MHMSDFNNEPSSSLPTVIKHIDNCQNLLCDYDMALLSALLAKLKRLKEQKRQPQEQEPDPDEEIRYVKA